MRNPSPQKRCGRAVAAGLLAALAFTTPFSTASAQEEDGEIVELDPFKVVAPGDFKYRKVTAVTAARMNVSILETPLNINVVADEFLDDTGVANLVDAFSYTSSINTSPDDLLRNNAILVRGFPVGFVLRDGYKKYYAVNLDGVDRIEVVKGPVSVFYGLAEPGGVINYVTKRPLFDPFQELKLEYGQDDHRKVYLDTTGPIMKDKLAYRLLGTYQDSESWKDFVSWERKYALASLGYQPFKGVTVFASYEYDDSVRRGGTNTALVGNPEYFRDYYTQPYKYGYLANWQELNAMNSKDNPIVLMRSIVPEGDSQVRYPYPQGDEETGAGGINPRYVNSGVDQSIFPEYMRNIELPYQHPYLNLDSASETSLDTAENARTYQRNWIIHRWIESGFTDLQPKFSENVYPFGYDYNPNGPYAINLDESHIATGELLWVISEGLKFRYGFNYLELKTFRSQQYNSDTDMDGSTLNQIQGLRPNVSIAIHGAALNDFVNRYYTHQAELHYTFKIGTSEHTLTTMYEYRDDMFISFTHNTSDTFKAQNAIGWEGVGIVDIYVDDFARYDLWDGGRIHDSDSILINNMRKNNKVQYDKTVGTYTAQTQEGVGINYRGKFFGDSLNLMGGVRHEHQYIEPLSLIDSTPSSDPDQSITDLSGTVPTVGLTYRLPGPANEFVLFASYSESFTGLASGVSNASYEIPNPEDPLNPEADITIKPTSLGKETGLGYEIGFKTEFRKNLINGSASLFHLEKDGLVTTDTAAINAFEDAWNSVPQRTDRPATPALKTNSGLQTSEGVEIDLIVTPTPNWQFTFAGSWLFTREKGYDTLDFGDYSKAPGTASGPWPIKELYTQDPDLKQFEYSRLDSGEIGLIDVTPEGGAWRPKTLDEIEAWEAENGPMPYEPKEHQVLTSVPEYQLSVWSKYDFTDGPLKGFTFGVGGKYQSETYPHAERIRGFLNESFIIFDALLRYSTTFSDKSVITISLNVNNVLDERVTRAGQFGINDPRTWKLTLSYKF